MYIHIHESELILMRKSSKSRRASTVEGREDQLCALAVDCAERQLREGTASPSVIVHYLRLCSPKAIAEMEYLKKQTELVSAKTEAIKSGERMDELYKEAITAFRSYNGVIDEEKDENLY